MKRGYKNLLSVLGALGLVMPFAGCETDAQEAQADAKESVVTNAAAAREPAKPLVSARLPMRTSACSTIASTAGLMPKNSAWTICSSWYPA